MNHCLEDTEDPQWGWRNPPPVRAPTWGDLEMGLAVTQPAPSPLGAPHGFSTWVWGHNQDPGLRDVF